MRHAIDTHKMRQRPTVAEVVTKIGPMRNTVAATQGSEVRRERKGRRG
jgi:5-methyltetrahydrofolate--homocysteine methyltransferase